MKNPYQLLGISQDATKAEVLKAFNMSLLKRRCTPHEAAVARAQLSKADSRLASDFMLPVFPDTDKIELVEQTTKSKDIDIDSIDANKYNSL
jgi:hypothetical protein